MKFTLFLRKTDSESNSHMRLDIFDRNRTGEIDLVDITAENLEEAKAKATKIMSERITERYNFDQAHLYTHMEDTTDLIKAANDLFMEKWHADRKEKMRQQLAYLKKELGEE